MDDGKAALWLVERRVIFCLEEIMMEEGKEWCGEHIIHNGFKIILKSVNLQCNTLVCWFRRDKVLFFFTISCKILFKTCLNSFLNFFYSKNKEFWVPQVYKKLWKRIMLGTLDAWSMSLLFRRLREPVYYIVDWRISKVWCTLGTTDYGQPMKE